MNLERAGFPQEEVVGERLNSVDGSRRSLAKDDSVLIESLKKTLIIAPNGGFANRLRTMVSAIHLAKKLDVNIEHLWIGTPYKCAFKHIQYIHDKSFEYFFKQSINRCDYKIMMQSVNKVYTEWMQQDEWYDYQSYGQKLLQPSILSKLDLVNEDMDVTENFLIETTYINNLTISKEEKTQIYSTYFVPKDEFLVRINILDRECNVAEKERSEGADPEKRMVETSAKYSNNTIGIGIRRGDFLYIYPENIVDDNLLIAWLVSIELPVLFVSDDIEYETRMRQHLKHPVIPIFEAEDVDKGFLQFLLLSKCSKIYGTLASSFYEEAAIFGGVDYMPLTKEFFKQ